MSPGQGVVPRDLGRLLLHVWILAVVPACSFERMDRGLDEEPHRIESVPSPGMETSEEDLTRSAKEVVGLFRQSVATGDLTLALSLVDREAALVDALVGQASEAATRGELLLELRRRHASGIQLEPLETEVELLTNEVALVMSVLAMLQVGAEGIGEEVGRVSETVLLMASPEGWKIRHLHRSLVPEG